jgi:UDP-glucose 4-epimerase
MHFAGKKAVAESVERPLLYFESNLGGAVALLQAMQDAGVRRLVFSSSATVYGLPETLPVDERAATGPINPYGQTKLMIETVIDALCAAEPAFAAMSLRYFNPVGAHPSGLIGEDPRGIPNNLFPFVAQTAAGRRDKVRVFGDDYPTPDGTGVRDYIHVVDLARGHLAALERLMADRAAGHTRLNLGTGRGHSVLEAIAAFARASGREISYEVVGRRAGDVATLVADPSAAERLLGWRAERGLDEMCADHWRYHADRG